MSFRARSVPAALVVEVTPRIESLSDSKGAVLLTGNASMQGIGRIKTRRILGDNNANQRLDIGDAVVVSRLQVGLEERRSWDIGLNDLNTSGSIDSGDVVKVLRAVVGLDPQPRPLSLGPSLAKALNLSPVGANTNDVLSLELLDGPVAKAGEAYRVAVRVVRAGTSLSGLSFTLKHPTALVLSGKQVGELIPNDALPFWAETADEVKLAAVRSTVWPGKTGVAAVLTFVPAVGISSQAEWGLSLESIEVTGSGFDTRSVDSVSAIVKATTGPILPPSVPAQITLTPPNVAGGKWSFEVRAGNGETVVIESTDALGTPWSQVQQVTGRGVTTPVPVNVELSPSVLTRFWRVR